MPFKSRAQKEYLRINEPEIYERWMRDYDAESFTPPASAVSAAKKGLSQRKKWGRGGLSPADAKSQGIDSGVTRARKISSGKVSRHDVRRMSAFNRHRQNNNPSKKMPDGGPTAGTIAWNLWGGTSGVNWAKKKSAAMNAETFEAHACDCSNSYRYRFDRDLTAVECDRCGGYLDAHKYKVPSAGVVKYAEDEEEELNKYMVSVPVLHHYTVGPVEAYDEEEAAEDVRENWSEWRRTIDNNGDWGGPMWRYLPWYDADPEAYEVFDSETFESPVSCKICGKTFDSFRGLNGHMNAHLPSHRKRAEDEEEEELNKYMVSVPVLHHYTVGPVEAYDEEEAAEDVRENWSEWRRTIDNNGDWGGPMWRYLPWYDADPEAYEVFDSETFGDVDSDGQLAQALARARAKSQEPRRPLKITKLPHQDQTSLKDFEAESNTPLFTKESKVFAIGLASGIVATIFGNLLSEFVIDRYREDPELLDTEQNA